MKKPQSPKPKTEPSATIAARIPLELFDRFEKAVSFTQGNNPTTLRILMEAFCAYVEECGGITLPLAIVPLAMVKMQRGEITYDTSVATICPPGTKLSSHDALTDEEVSGISPGNQPSPTRSPGKQKRGE